MPLEPEEVGKRLKAARALQGHEDQADFARWLNAEYGVAAVAYAAYERGQRTLQGRDLMAIKVALGLSDRWLTAPREELLGEAAPASIGARFDRLEAMLAHLLPVDLDELDQADDSG